MSQKERGARLRRSDRPSDPLSYPIGFGQKNNPPDRAIRQIGGAVQFFRSGSESRSVTLGSDSNLCETLRAKVNANLIRSHLAPMLTDSGRNRWPILLDD